MACSVDGCEREVMYVADQLCQMHYFRRMRNGDFVLKRDKKLAELGYTRKYRHTMPGKPYQHIYEPTCPLAHKNGYVAEHRYVVYQDLGDSLPPCELCGKDLTWEICHIDHIDRDPTNNARSNLRPLCRVCNTTRDRPPEHSFSHNGCLTIDGVSDTPEGWSRRVGGISGAQIRYRKKRLGMSDYDAVYSEKITHNGKLPIKKPRPPAHTRKNAIVITIDGITQTAMEWSRHPECVVSDGSIRARIKAGWDHGEAVFGKDGRKNILTNRA